MSAVCFSSGWRWPSLFGVCLWWALSPAASAATPEAAPSPQAPIPPLGWIDANRQVAEFPRGHADVLKWEQARRMALPARPHLPALPDLQPLLRTALLQRPDLWVLPGDGELAARSKNLAVATWSRDLWRAWWNAAAAARDAELATDASEAVELATELTRRMVGVGHWPESRRLQDEQTHLIQQLGLQQALLRARQAHQALWTAAGLEPPTAQDSGPPVDNAPDWRHLPVPPEPQALATARDGARQHPQGQRLYADWQQARQAWPEAQRQAWQKQLPTALLTGPATTQPSASVWLQAPVLDRRALAWTHQAERALEAEAQWKAWQTRWQQAVQQAWDRQTQAHLKARAAVEQRLPLAQAQEKEAQLRYNGMLVSTWDLLQTTQARIQAERDATAAVHDAWLAQLDWQALQAGAFPAEPAASAPNDRPATPSATGH